MCGGDASIRIEPADNGFSIDVYTPGNGDRPGHHRKMVATSPDQVLKLQRPHLARIGKKKGRRGHGPELVGEQRGPKKRTARKKG